MKHLPVKTAHRPPCANPNHQKWMAPLQQIQTRVCEEFGVTLERMRSPSRMREIVMPRHIAMWICRRLTMASLPAIAFSFGGRDHTTVIHGCRNAEVLMGKSQYLKEKTETILRNWSDEKTAK